MQEKLSRIQIRNKTQIEEDDQKYRLRRFFTILLQADRARLRQVIDQKENQQIAERAEKPI